jgi:hypothetical protein
VFYRFDLSELLADDDSIPAHGSTIVGSAFFSSSAGDAHVILSHTSLISYRTLSMQLIAFSIVLCTLATSLTPFRSVQSYAAASEGAGVAHRTDLQLPLVASSHAASALASASVSEVPPASAATSRDAESSTQAAVSSVAEAPTTSSSHVAAVAAAAVSVTAFESHAASSSTSGNYQSLLKQNTLF